MGIFKAVGGALNQLSEFLTTGGLLRIRKIKHGKQTGTDLDL